MRAYLAARTDTVLETEANCRYRARITRQRATVFVRQFTNGTLTIDGPPELFSEVDQAIRNVLGNTGDLLSAEQRRDAAKRQAVADVERGTQWIGSDEAGKGDYFGPLVVAAVLADAERARQLEALEVRDSKRLSDRRSIELAAQIRAVCGAGAQVVQIGPQRYNELYEQFRAAGRNLNHLLAWAHARAVKAVLAAAVPGPVTVLVDRFGREALVEQSFSAQEIDSARVRLVQLPGAEADPAVAAASILARAAFLEALTRLTDEAGMTLPRGASAPQILETANALVARQGNVVLARFAKLHFATTQHITR